MRCLVVALTIVLTPGVVLAQPAETRSGLPPIQLGVGPAHFSMADLDISLGGISAAPEVRLTVPWSPRFAFETVVMVTRRHYATPYYDVEGEKKLQSTHLEGVYAFQIRQRLEGGARGGFESFVTYGGTGYYDFITDAPETVLRFADGQLSAIRASDRRNLPPVATTVGYGVQQQLGRHLALRADLQLLAVVVKPFGFRASASVTVPLGQFP